MQTIYFLILLLVVSYITHIILKKIRKHKRFRINRERGLEYINKFKNKRPVFYKLFKKFYDENDQLLFDDISRLNNSLNDKYIKLFLLNDLMKYDDYTNLSRFLDVIDGLVYNNEDSVFSKHTRKFDKNYLSRLAYKYVYNQGDIDYKEFDKILHRELKSDIERIIQNETSIMLKGLESKGLKNIKVTTDWDGHSVIVGIIPDHIVSRNINSVWCLKHKREFRDHVGKGYQFYVYSVNNKFEHGITLCREMKIIKHGYDGNNQETKYRLDEKVFKKIISKNYSLDEIRSKPKDLTPKKVFKMINKDKELFSKVKELVKNHNSL